VLVRLDAADGEGSRNLDHAAIGPDIGLDIVTGPRWAPQRAVLSNSFGFGGQNVSLLFVP
jgi:3-oxoacyl-[acyl-carrier-protein] synthase II